MQNLQATDLSGSTRIQLFVFLIRVYPLRSAAKVSLVSVVN